MTLSPDELRSTVAGVYRDVFSADLAAPTHINELPGGLGVHFAARVVPAGTANGPIVEVQVGIEDLPVRGC